MNLTVELPWPSPGLSQNGRLHYMAHARAAKKAKNAAWGYTKAAMGTIRPGTWQGPIAVHMVFHVPAQYRYDRDGLMARMKSALDGIALALDVDDYEFRPTLEMGKPAPPDGKVVVTLTPSAVMMRVEGKVK